jgi:aspartyl-tRNA(Asn)/glutamyl-tRNA(Gln) amidotransferase subunit B
MRSKEQAHDYRYFPEPDLPPLVIDEGLLQRTSASLPELPLARRARFIEALGLSDYDAGVLTAERDVADYYERVVKAGADPHKMAKPAANWVTTSVLHELKRDERPIDACPISPEALAELIGLVDAGTISGKIAKDVFEKMFASGRGAKAIVEAEGLVQVTDEGAIERAARQVIERNPGQVAKYKTNDKLLGFFVGQVMKETGGKANPEAVNRILKKLLGELVGKA